MKPTTTGKTVTIKNTETECVVFKSRYTNDRPALILIEAESGEQYCVASVNLPDDDIRDGEIAIKDYSENAGVLDALIDGGVVSEPIGYISSGFVDVPVCRLLV